MDSNCESTKSKFFNKRKGIKLECFDCGQTFDNDSKQKHIKQYTMGK